MTILIITLFILLSYQNEDYCLRISGTSSNLFQNPYLPTASYSLDQYTEELWLKIISSDVRIFVNSPSNYLFISPSLKTATFHYSQVPGSSSTSSAATILYNPYEWLHFAITKNNLAFKLFINSEEVLSWSVVGISAVTKASYILQCDSINCVAQARRYRKWSIAFGSSDIFAILAKTSCIYGDNECLLYYELNDATGVHKDRSKNKLDVAYQTCSSLSQVMSNTTITTESGYADSSVSYKVKCSSPFRALADYEIMTNKYYPTVDLELSMEFWLYIGPYLVSTDLDVDYWIIEAKPNTGYATSYRRINCGLKNRKISCAFYTNNVVTTKIIIQQQGTVDTLLSKWTYVSFQSKDVVTPELNEIKLLLLSSDNSIISSSTDNCAYTTTAYFTSVCSSGTTDLSLYIKELRMWAKRRGKGDVIRTANNELNPLDHRLLLYYAPLNEYRGGTITQQRSYYMDMAAYSSISATEYQDPYNNKAGQPQLWQFDKTITPLTLCKSGYDYNRAIKLCLKYGKRIAKFYGENVFDHTSSSPVYPITVEAWVWIPSTNSATNALWSVDNGLKSIVLYVNPTLNMAIIGNGNTASATSTKTISTNTWFYVQSIIDNAGSYQLISNGDTEITQSYTPSLSLLTTTFIARFGKSTTTPTDKFYGCLFNIRIWFGQRYGGVVKETQQMFPSHFLRMNAFYSMLETSILNGKVYSRVDDSEQTINGVYSLVLLTLPFVCVDDQYYDGIQCSNNFRTFQSLVAPTNYATSVFTMPTTKSYSWTFWLFVMDPTTSGSIAQISASSYQNILRFASPNSFIINTNNNNPPDNITKAYTPPSPLTWIHVMINHYYAAGGSNKLSLCIQGATPICSSNIYPQSLSTKSVTITYYKFAAPIAFAIKSHHIEYYAKSEAEFLSTDRDRDQYDYNIMISSIYSQSNYDITGGKAIISTFGGMRSDFKTEIYLESLNQAPLITCPSGYYFSVDRCLMLSVAFTGVNTLAFSAGVNDDIFLSINSCFAVPKVVLGIWLMQVSGASFSILSLNSGVFSISYSAATGVTIMYNNAIVINYTQSLAPRQWYHITFGHYIVASTEYMAILLNGVIAYKKSLAISSVLTTTITTLSIPPTLVTDVHIANANLVAFADISDLHYLYAKGPQSLDRKRVALSFCSITSNSKLSLSGYRTADEYLYFDLTSAVTTNSKTYPVMMNDVFYLIKPSSTQSFPTKGQVSTNFTADFWLFVNSYGDFSVEYSNLIYAAINSTTKKLYLKKSSSQPILISTKPKISLNNWYYITIMNNASYLSMYVNGVLEGNVSSITTTLLSSYDFKVVTTTGLISIAQPRLWKRFISYDLLSSYSRTTLDNMDTSLIFHLVPCMYERVIVNNKISMCELSYTAYEKLIYSLDVDSIDIYPALPLCSSKQYFNGQKCVVQNAIIFRAKDYAGQMIPTQQSFYYGYRYLTLEAWVHFRIEYVDSYANTVFGIEEFRTGGERIFIVDSCSSSSQLIEVKLRFESNTTSNAECLRQTLTDNDWHHIAFTMNTTSAMLYINGIYKSIITLPTYITNTDKRSHLIIGRMSNDFSPLRLIGMSQLRFWNFSLSAQQILLNMNNKLPYNTIAQLISYYDLVSPALPNTMNDNGYLSSFKYKIIITNINDKATAYIDSTQNVATSLKSQFTECPLYYKLDKSKYQCALNVQIDINNRKSFHVCSLNKFRVPLNTYPLSTADFTLEFWTKFTYLDPLFTKFLIQTPSPGITMLISGTSLSTSTDGATTTSVGSNCGFSIYEWNHIALVNNISNSTIMIYNNELYCGSQVSLLGMYEKEMVFGDDTEQTTQFKLREFRLWAKPLSLNKLWRHKFKMINTNNVVDCIMYYRLNEGKGLTIYEQVSNSRGISTYDSVISTNNFESIIWTEDVDISICDISSEYNAILNICENKKLPILYSPNQFNINLPGKYDNEFSVIFCIYQYSPISDAIIMQQRNHFTIYISSNQMCADIIDSSNELCISAAIATDKWTYMGLSINAMGMPCFFVYNDVSTSNTYNSLQFGAYNSQIQVGGYSDIVVANIRLYSRIISASDMYYESRNKNSYSSDLISYIPMTLTMENKIVEQKTTTPYDCPSAYFMDYPTELFEYASLAFSANSVDPINIPATLRVNEFSVECWVKLKSAATVSLFGFANSTPTTIISVGFNSNQFQLIHSATTYLTSSVTTLNQWVLLHYSVTSNGVTIFTSPSTIDTATYVNSSQTPDPMSGTISIKNGNFYLKNIIFYSTPPNISYIQENYLTNINTRKMQFNIGTLITFDFNYDSGFIKKYNPITYTTLSTELNSISTINIVQETDSQYQGVYVSDTSPLTLCPANTYYNGIGTCITDNHYLYFQNQQTLQLSLSTLPFGKNPYSICFWLYTPIVLSVYQTIINKGELSISMNGTNLCWAPNNSASICSSTSVPANKWIYNCISNGNNLFPYYMIFTNNIEKNGTYVETSNQTDALTIGSNNIATTFTGAIAHLSLWNAFISKSVATKINHNLLVETASNKLYEYYKLTYSDEVYILESIHNQRFTSNYASNPLWITFEGLVLCPSQLTYIPDNQCVFAIQHPTLYFGEANKIITLPVNSALSMIPQYAFSFWVKMQDTGYINITSLGVIKIILNAALMQESLYIISTDLKLIDNTSILQNYWIHVFTSANNINSILQQWVYTTDRLVKHLVNTTVTSSLLPKQNSLLIELSSFNGSIKNLILQSQPLYMDPYNYQSLFTYPNTHSPSLLSYYPLNESIGNSLCDISMYGSCATINFDNTQWNSVPFSEQCSFSTQITIADDWKYIYIEYNLDFNYSPNSSANGTNQMCADLFNAATMVLLSTTSVCNITSDSIIITVGNTAIIKSNDALVYKTLSAFCSIECSHQCADDVDVSLTLPVLDFPPEATIDAPAIINVCTEFTISILNISGLAERKPLILFNCISASNFSASNSFFSCAPLNALFSALANDTKSVTLPSNITIANGAYNISITITNALGQSLVSHKVINSYGTELATISFNIDKSIIKVIPWLDFEITAYVTKMSCAGETKEKADAITWKITSPSNSAALEAKMNQHFTVNGTMVIPTGTLKEGTDYSLNVTYLNTVGQTTSWKAITLQVAEGPLIPIALSDSVSICQNETATLSLNKSYDYTTGNGDSITFNWVCKNILTDGDCFYANLSTIPHLTGSIITINSSKLPINSKFNWTIQLSKVGKIGAYFCNIVLETSSCIASIPALLHTFKNKALFTDKDAIAIYSESNINSSCSTTFEWLIDGTDTSALSCMEYPTTLLSNINIIPGALLPGNHKITLNLTQNCSSQISNGYASIAITLLSPPSDGSAIIDQTNGVELTTEFTVQLSNWKNAIAYSVQYKDGGDTNAKYYDALKPSQSSTCIFKLPYLSSTPLNLRAKICSADDMCTYSALSDIVITQLNNADTVFATVFPSIINDPNSKVKQYELLKLLNMREHLDDANQEQLANESLTSLMDAITISDKDGQMLRVDIIEKLLNMTAPNYSDNMLKVLLQTESYISNCINSTIEYSYCQLDNKIISTLLSACSNISSNLSNESQLQSYHQIINTLSIANLYNIVSFENTPSTIISNDIITAATNIPKTSSSKTVQVSGIDFTFPNASKALENTTKGSVLITIQTNTTKPSKINTKVSGNTNLFSINVFSEGDFYNPLSIAANSVVFSFTKPVPSNKSNYRCAFYDTEKNAYSFVGTKYTYANNKALCEYQHLTEFALLEAPTPTLPKAASVFTLSKPSLSFVKVIAPKYESTTINAANEISKITINNIIAYKFVSFIGNKSMILI